MPAFCLLFGTYERFIDRKCGGIPPRQRKCKVCSNKWALIKKIKDGKEIKGWIQVQDLAIDKGSGTSYTYVCPDCRPKDEALSAKQTHSCRLCKDNREARPWFKSSIRIDLIKGENYCESTGSKKTLAPLKTTDIPCCEANCTTYTDLVQAYKAGIERRGVRIDPCENCVKYWNQEHPQPCMGKFNQSGPVVTYTL